MTYYDDLKKADKIQITRNVLALLLILLIIIVAYTFSKINAAVMLMCVFFGVALLIFALLTELYRVLIIKKQNEVDIYSFISNVLLEIETNDDHRKRKYLLKKLIRVLKNYLEEKSEFWLEYGVNLQAGMNLDERVYLQSVQKYIRIILSKYKEYDLSVQNPVLKTIRSTIVVKRFEQIEKRLRMVLNIAKMPIKKKQNVFSFYFSQILTLAKNRMRATLLIIYVFFAIVLYVAFIKETTYENAYFTLIVLLTLFFQLNKKGDS